MAGSVASYLRFYRAKLPEETTLSTFERLLARPGELVGLVAEVDEGALLGFAPPAVPPINLVD
jgi:hypothetical protein